MIHNTPVGYDEDNTLTYTLQKLNVDNSAWQPRRVDRELDTGGRGEELVRKGLDTVRARLATERVRYK